MAAMAASLSAGATSKSGWPIERLIGSLRLRARSKILRMPLESMRPTRAARRVMAALQGPVAAMDARSAQLDQHQLVVSTGLIMVVDLVHDLAHQEHPQPAGAAVEHMLLDVDVGDLVGVEGAAAVGDLDAEALVGDV